MPLIQECTSCRRPTIKLSRNLLGLQVSAPAGARQADRRAGRCHADVDDRPAQIHIDRSTSPQTAHQPDTLAELVVCRVWRGRDILLAGGSGNIGRRAGLGQPMVDKAAIAGGGLCALTFATTLSIMLAVPIWEVASGGFPWLNRAGSFLIKDLALLGVSLMVLAEGLLRRQRRARLPASNRATVSSTGH